MAIRAIIELEKDILVRSDSRSSPSMIHLFPLPGVSPKVPLSPLSV